jgi:hypothetical protein
MRRCLVMLLSFMCIVLPLQVTASMEMAGQHCPHMQPHMQNMAAGSPADAGDRHDCCNDAATVAKTGQLCKTGYECSPLFSYLLTPGIFHLAFTSAVTQTPTLRVPTYSGPPSAVWRPPTLI